MNECSLREAPCVEQLLGLKQNPDHEWNSYIQTLVKDTGKIIDSLWHSSKYLSPPDILYVYKSPIRP